MNNIKKPLQNTSRDYVQVSKLAAKFITLEGSEGAGKSTAMKVIKEKLESWQVPFISTREPGGEHNAEHIRELLLHSQHLAAKTELLLMFAARNEHLEKVIRPTLADGTWVVSDRFVDASYAYQGFGRGIDWSSIEYLEKFVVGTTKPDLTLLLDVDPAEGLNRAANRSNKDRIEREALSFFENIRKGYHQRVKSEPERIKVVNANDSIEAVAEAINSELQLFKNKIS